MSARPARRLRVALPLLAVIAATTAIPRAEAADLTETALWPNTPAARQQAETLLQRLNADLLSHPSATLTLDRWCRIHGLASPARVAAEPVHDAYLPPTAAQRQLLAVAPDTPVIHRRVRLRCGGYVLSEADNWYVPSRLTPAMNHQLETSDIAFGRAVQDLHFRRHTLAVRLLWHPGTSDGGGEMHIPARVLQHQAVLVLPDGTPFSEVIETYTGAVLAFPPH